MVLYKPTSKAVILATVSSPNSSLEAKTVVCLFVGWLVGWLVAWLVGWLLGWLVGWFAARVATRSRIDHAITIEMFDQ